MHRVRALDGRVPEPLRPQAVLWLLPPWAALLAFAADAVRDAFRPAAMAPSGFTAGLAAAASAVGLTGATIYFALPLAFTWLWLAAAVPGEGPRLGLWAASAALAAPWAFALANAPGQAVLAALSLATAATAVLYAIVAAALRAHASRPGPRAPEA